jgi:hypothetical protein
VKRRRRKPRTVLDRLEDEGVILPPQAKKLRRIALAESAQGATTVRRSVAGEKPDYTLEFLTLIAALLQPARADTRIARVRNFALALEHAYYEAIGEPKAIKRTADASGMSLRTVSDAVRTTPRVPEFLIPTLVSMIRSPDSWRNTTKRDSIAAIRRMMRENSQTVRSVQLRQGLAALRKRIPAPRGRQ